MAEPEIVVALLDLLEAIDENMQRRVLLTRGRKGRRIQMVVTAHALAGPYERARAALRRAKYSAGISAR